MTKNQQKFPIAKFLNKKVFVVFAICLSLVPLLPIGNLTKEARGQAMPTNLAPSGSNQPKKTADSAISYINDQTKKVARLPKRLAADPKLASWYDKEFMEIDMEVTDLRGKYRELEGWNEEAEQKFQEALNKYEDASYNWLTARQEAKEQGTYFGERNLFYNIDNPDANVYADSKYFEIVRPRDTREGRRELPPGVTQAQVDRSGEIARGTAEQVAAEERAEEMAWERGERCFSPMKGFKWSVCFASILSYIANFFLKLFGTVLWVTSSIFDLSVYVSIVSFKKILSFDGVDAVWRVMRDLANLSFIFILFYAAISVIFDLQLGGKGPKKLIVEVIIIALLVNFSGFIVRVVVDAGNIVAYEFYSRMSYDPQARNGIILDKVNPNIGTALVSKLNLATHIIPADEKNDNLRELTSLKSITSLGPLQVVIGAIGGVVIILMASFVLLSASILFFIRTIVLLFVYAFSPIALVAKVFPLFQGTYTKWKDALIKQTFFAPGFLIPLFAVFKILGNKGINGLVGDFGIGSGFSGTLALAFVQIMIMGMIVSCMFIAQILGAFGLNLAKNISGQGVGMLTRLPVGTTRLLGQAPLSFYRRVRNTGQGADRTPPPPPPSSPPPPPTDGGTTDEGEAGGTTPVPKRKAFARWAAGLGADAGRAVATSAKEGARDVYESVKASTEDKVRHPLLFASDVISTAASQLGVKDFNILGKTREERTKAKKEEKEKKTVERNKRINQLLRESLETSVNDFEAVKRIVSGIEKDALKVIDLKIFADIPQAARALSHNQIIALTNREGKEVDDGKYRPRIRDHILAEDTANVAPVETNIYEYMNAGAGRVFWR